MKNIFKGDSINLKNPNKLLDNNQTENLSPNTKTTIGELTKEVENNHKSNKEDYLFFINAVNKWSRLSMIISRLFYTINNIRIEKQIDNFPVLNTVITSYIKENKKIYMNQMLKELCGFLYVMQNNPYEFRINKKSNSTLNLNSLDKLILEYFDELKSNTQQNHNIKSNQPDEKLDTVEALFETFDNNNNLNWTRFNNITNELANLPEIFQINLNQEGKSPERLQMEKIIKEWAYLMFEFNDFLDNDWLEETQEVIFYGQKNLQLALETNNLHQARVIVCGLKKTFIEINSLRQGLKKENLTTVNNIIKKSIAENINKLN